MPACAEEPPVKKAKVELLQRQCGSSGLTVSCLAYGCWQLGQKGADDYWGLEVTQPMADDLVKQAAEAGITYFDTAEDYAKGGSETQLGAALKVLPKELRRGVVVGSKILPNNCGDVAASLDGTLQRLGVDCIDLYMVHWPIDKNSMAHFAGGHNAAGGRDYAETGKVVDSEVPLTTRAFTQLAEAQRQGKIRHIGVSNFGVAQLEEALATGAKIAVNQVCYNLISRAAELEVLPFCERHGIGVFAYSPLMQGLLTGRWASADEVPEYRARTRHFSGRRPKSRHGEAGHEELLLDTLRRLREIADAEKVPLEDLALAYPLSKPVIASVIAGATSSSQLASNARAARLQLSPGLVARLDAATEELKLAMGGNCDLWQGGADARTR